MPTGITVRIAAPATLAEALASSIGPHVQRIQIDPEREYLWRLAGEWPNRVILLIATNLPEVPALPLAEYVTGRLPEVRIVMLTRTPSTILAQLAAHYGAHAAVSQVCGLSMVRAAVRSAADGIPWYFGRPTPGDGFRTALKPTPRELDVLTALTTCPTRNAAAADLRMGIDTLDRHVASLRVKLDAPGSAQLHRLAAELGLVSPDDSRSRPSGPTPAAPTTWRPGRNSARFPPS